MSVPSLNNIYYAINELGCHKTDEQMLRESHAELLAALGDVLDSCGARGTFDAFKQHDAVARAEAAIANAESVA